jgi:hypothetical protein
MSFESDLVSSFDSFLHDLQGDNRMSADPAAPQRRPTTRFALHDLQGDDRTSTDPAAQQRRPTTRCDLHVLHGKFSLLAVSL